MSKTVKARRPQISVIVPVFNEDLNVLPLAKEISNSLKSVGLSWECIWVNDGSTDESGRQIDSLPWPHRSVHHPKNLGQSRSIGSGISTSRGKLIVTLDGDGQNDPNDIPRMLELLGSDYDLIQGQRLDRQDKYLRTKLSQIANLIARKMLKSKFTDLGCSLRIVRREFLKGIEFIGEVHRVLAFHIESNGARVREVEVNHRPRINGKSKYGYNRIFKFILDLVLLNFLLRFREKPLYYFGILGFITITIGSISVITAFILRLIEIKTYLDSSLIVGGIIMIINSVLFIGMGLLGEIVTRTNSSESK